MIKINLKNKKYYNILIIINVLSVIFLPSFVSIVIIGLSMYCNLNVGYVLLILSPILGFLGSISTGFTISRVLGLFFIALIILKIIKNELVIKKSNEILLFWILILMIMIGLVISSSNGYYLIGISNKELISENISKISKVLLGFFIFVDISNKSLLDIKKIISSISKGLTLALLIICMYILFIGKEFTTSFGLERISVAGMDSNELANTIVMIITFIIFSMNTINEKKFKFISIITIMIAIVTAYLTYSRTGIINIICIILLVLIVYIDDIKKLISYLVSIVSGIIFLQYKNFININTIIERFNNRSASANSPIGELTAGRSDYWLAGIDYISNNNLLLGLGGSNVNESYINTIYYSDYHVMHNTFLETFVQYGLLGVLILISIISYIIFNYIRYRKFIKNNCIEIISICISFISILVAGLALDWLFRDILWIFIGLNLGTIKIIKNSLIQEYKNLRG